MNYVRTEYAASGLPDSEFAKKMSAELKVDYSRSEVTQYRQSFGLPNNAPRVPANTELTDAKALLEECMELSFGNNVDLFDRIKEFLGK